MSSLRPFQIALLAGSLVLFLGAIAFLAIWRPAPCEETGDCPVKITDEINIWGTLSRQVFDEQIRTITQNSE